MLQTETIQSIFKTLDRPVWVITSCYEGQKSGMIATWVSQASLDPNEPRILAAISPLHFSHDIISQSNRCVAHLLTFDELDYVWRFGLQSGHQADKFEDLQYEINENGLPVLKNCHSYMECEIQKAFPAGDRTFFVAKVTQAELVKPSKTLLFESVAIQNASAENLQKLKSQLAADIEVQNQQWNQFVDENG